MSLTSITNTLDSTSSLIELSESGTKMCWETLICRHFCETTGDLSESLGPTGSRISHHCDILSHISEILSQGDTSINRGFSGSDRHVRGISDQAGSIHDGNISVTDFSSKLRELFKYLSHFVSSLTASDVDNTLSIGEFRQSLRNTCLSTSESTGNSTGSSEGGWVKRIKYSLSSKEGLDGRQSVLWWSRLTNGPEMS